MQLDAGKALVARRNKYIRVDATIMRLTHIYLRSEKQDQDVMRFLDAVKQMVHLTDNALIADDE